MARTESMMLPPGTPAPDFALPDPDGRIHRLDDYADAPALLVVFMCNHCPYVIHLKGALADFGRDRAARGLAMVGINANDWTAYPDDAPDRMKADIEKFGYPFPYLVDEEQRVAAAYGAVCTPDFFLFDGKRHLAYRGQFDDSRPGNDKPVTGADLSAAVDAVLAGKPYEGPQRPSVGCSIKWRPGREPDGKA